MAMTIKQRFTIGTLCAAYAVLACLFIHPDVYPSLHTYGFSVGTNSSYCSVELVSDHVSASCQKGQ